jgi:hypothetical protein
MQENASWRIPLRELRRIIVNEKWHAGHGLCRAGMAWVWREFAMPCRLTVLPNHARVLDEMWDVGCEIWDKGKVQGVRRKVQGEAEM